MGRGQIKCKLNNLCTCYRFLIEFNKLYFSKEKQRQTHFFIEIRDFTSSSTTCCQLILLLATKTHILYQLVAI